MTYRRCLVLATALCVLAACSNSSEGSGSAATGGDVTTPATQPLASSTSADPTVTEPVPTDAPTTEAPTTTAPTPPPGWRSPSEVADLLAFVPSPPATMADCLAASPFSAENNDAAVLACLTDAASRKVYAAAMFDRSEDVALLQDIPNGTEWFRNCVSVALSADLIHDRLVELATDDTYWAADREGDEVAAAAISRQFGFCWQTLALG